MEMLTFVIAFVLGVACYRLGRKEGEAGRVLPLVTRKPKRNDKADKLLKDIENYQGK